MPRVYLPRPFTLRFEDGRVAEFPTAGFHDVDGEIASHPFMKRLLVEEDKTVRPIRPGHATPNPEAIGPTAASVAHPNPYHPDWQPLEDEVEEPDRSGPTGWPDAQGDPSTAARRTEAARGPTPPGTIPGTVRNTTISPQRPPQSITEMTPAEKKASGQEDEEAHKPELKKADAKATKDEKADAKADAKADKAAASAWEDAKDAAKTAAAKDDAADKKK